MIFPEKSLRYIECQPDNTRTVLLGGPTTNAKLAKSLGILPDNNVKLFIGVEGRNDFTFLKQVSKALRASGVDVLDLERMEIEGEIIFFPLGGSNLSLWTSRLAHLNRPEVHIFDRDNAPPDSPKYQSEATAINQRDRCKAIITGKREMENYIHFEAINEAYSRVCNIQLAIGVNWGPFDDVPSKIAELVHSASSSPSEWSTLEDELKGKKASQVKRILNEHGANFMTIDRLNQIDPDGDVMSWLQAIKDGVTSD